MIVPVFKYKSLEEAKQALWKVEPDESLESLSRLWDLAAFINPGKKCQKGVFKFRTLEEAQKHREESLKQD